MQHISLNHYPDFVMMDFLSHFAQENKAIICVYDYSILQVSQRTCSMTVTELLECFKSEDDGRPLNFLHVQNCTCHLVLPSSHHPA